MTTTIFGTEAEYSLLSRGARRPPADIARAVMELARQTLACLPGRHSPGLFLGNGGRFYVDNGFHPEYCTPEVDHPDDLVRHVRAGDAIMAHLVRELRERAGWSDVALLRCNVNYARPGLGCGFHESYQHRVEPRVIRPMLLPFLASRPILGGAGGLDPLSPGIVFTLSPRAHLLREATSDCTTRLRPIIHTRDEPHADHGVHRLHLICGEALCGREAIWLRAATTALVVALVDAGFGPDPDLVLASPVQAMHAFCHDPALQARARLANGSGASALDIQRRYLAFAERHLDHPDLPDWKDDALARWRRALDALDGPVGPGAPDWAIKLLIFDEQIRQRGFTWTTLAAWRPVLEDLRSAMIRQGDRRPLDPARVHEPGSPLREAAEGWAAHLDAHGLDWGQLGPLIDLRSTLAAIDVRFSRLEPAGTAARLDEHLDREPSPEHAARTAPPARTRAAARGRWVLQHSGRRGYAAEWDALYDAQGRCGHLATAETLRARWVPGPARSRAADVLLRKLYDRGCYERAWRMLRGGAAPDDPAATRWQCAAWIQSRRGRVGEAVAILDQCAGSSAAQTLPVEYVTVFRYQGLAPLHPDAETWMGRADESLASHAWPPLARANYLGHKGFILARRGRLEEAEAVLRDACGIAVPELHQRIAARNHADLADVLRIRGRRAQAAACLDRANLVYRSGRHRGERADYLLTYRAKLAADGGDRELARRLLARARRVQRQLENHLGAARTHLLEARLARSPTVARRRRTAIEGLRRTVPDLRDCPRLASILERWSLWTGDLDHREHGDRFWLL